jgi:hypothetical protein
LESCSIAHRFRSLGKDIDGSEANVLATARQVAQVSIDSVTIAGVTSMAGIKQAADTPNYVQGAKGYGQRLGAETADGFSDILIGGAVLPSLLH